MKKVTVVGAGTGINTLTAEAVGIMEEAEVIFGSARLISMASGLLKSETKRMYPIYKPKDILNAVREECCEKFVVLVSGDVGFYSAAAAMNETFRPYELSFVPGVSIVNAFFSRLGIQWHDAAFVSLHGRDTDIVSGVRRNRLTFCLTGNNSGKAGMDLCKAGFGHIRTYIGENIGSDDERIYETAAEKLVSFNLPSLTVLLFENNNFDVRVPCGMPDNSFLRIPEIPMTKSEVRAVVISKLRLSPGDICCDIGAGTGSVTAELALNAYNGHIYSIDRRQDAVCLTRQNCEAFHIGNVTYICGDAVCALEGIPTPDAVFIGGGGLGIRDIITAVFNKNPRVRIAVTAITLETVFLALEAFRSVGAEPEIVQIGVTKAKQVRGMNMMTAQNPVTILSVGMET